VQRCNKNSDYTESAKIDLKEFFHRTPFLNV
jgi:hypothetical protein